NIMRNRGTCVVGVCFTCACVCALTTPASAVVTGSFFLTGHDPDFHASAGGNTAGAIDINQKAIAFVMDPGFNPFVAGGVNKFLFVEGNIAPPLGHIDGELGILASGYTAGTSYERHGATTGLNTELNLLGTKYSAIVIG